MDTSNHVATYRQKITALLREIEEEEEASVTAAANVLLRQIQADRLIHVYGAGGHSVIGTEEFFWRAGGLCHVSPLFEPSLLLSGGGYKSTLLERVPGIGDKIVASRDLGPDDVLVITSIYGMNAATIDAALEAKRRNCMVVAITSRQHAARTPADFVARHPSKKNLFEIADITIDNHVPHGDLLLRLPGFDQPLAASSSILVSFVVNWLVLETVQLCLDRGVAPKVWLSGNVPGGDAVNERYMAEFLPRVKAL